MVNFQNPQTRTLLISLIFGGLLISIVLIISLLPKEIEPPLLTPTPTIAVTPFPTPEIISKTEDNILILRKTPNGKYIVESLDPAITDKEIKEKLRIDDKIEFEVVIPGPAIPNIDEESLKNEKTYDEVIKEEYGLDPNYKD